MAGVGRAQGAAWTRGGQGPGVGGNSGAAEPGMNDTVVLDSPGLAAFSFLTSARSADSASPGGPGVLFPTGFTIDPLISLFVAHLALVSPLWWQHVP